MTGGGVDRSVECTGSINAMISAFECVHDVIFSELFIRFVWILSLTNFMFLNLHPFFQGWGVAVLVGVPNKDDAFKTHPINVLNERTLKGTFFGNYKPRTDLPAVVEKYMSKVSCIATNSASFCLKLYSFAHRITKNSELHLWTQKPAILLKNPNTQQDLNRS